MSPDDALAVDDNTYVLSHRGYDYILYSGDTHKELMINHLDAGSYSDQRVGGQ